MSDRMPDAPDAASAVRDRIVAVRQLEPLAAERLAGPVWDYVSGGAGDERTLQRNTSEWGEVRLAPRTLVDVSQVDTSVRLLGHTLAHPILIAPTARHTAYTPDGELATVAGARDAEAVYVLSSLSGTPLDDVAAAARQQPWWFQLYVQRDRAFTADLVHRAVAAGAQALVLTVDTPTLGARDRDRRSNLGSPDGVSYPILADAPLRIETIPAHRRVYNPLLAPDITWSDLDWLIDLASVPVVVKGVLRPDDAVRYAAAGVSAVIVSNHGARNLDSVPATVEALPPIVDAVADIVPVLVDGGIRRGTDVAKALCLGASAVLVGRPAIWGLATYGAAGLTHVIDILRTELEMSMALLGAPRRSDLTADLLWSD